MRHSLHRLYLSIPFVRRGWCAKVLYHAGAKRRKIAEKVEKELDFLRGGVLYLFHF